MKICVATVQEAEALIPDKYKDNVVTTGIGMINTLETLRDLNLIGDYVVNVGFAGGHNVPVGEVRPILNNKMYQENNIEGIGSQLLTTYMTDKRWGFCYTASDFLNKTNKNEEEFFVDMELAAYSSLLCPVYSIKVVSDNLDLDSYNKSLEVNYKDVIQDELEKIERSVNNE